MAELSEATLAELGQLRDELARAELADEAFSAALARARLADLVDSRVLGQLLATAQAKPRRTKPLRLPVPYYGGKFGAAPLIEQAMGPIVNLVIPFGGSLGCLLGRSEPARVETANDKDGLIVNAWRAITAEPFAVAEACAMPVHELTLEAVHGWLLDERESLTQRLAEDPPNPRGSGDDRECIGSTGSGRGPGTTSLRTLEWPASMPPGDHRVLARAALAQEGGQASMGADKKGELFYHVALFDRSGI